VLGILNVESRCARRDAKNAAYVGSGFASRSPFKAFELTWREGDACNYTVAGRYAKCPRMKQYGQELKHLRLRIDTSAERRTTFLSSESNGGRAVPPIVDWNGEAILYAERGSFLEYVMLRFGHALWSNLWTPLEGLWTLQRMSDHRI